MSHKESGEAHANSEDEHSVQAIYFHVMNDVLVLRLPLVRDSCYSDRAHHTLAMKMSPPEIKQKADTSSEGGRDEYTEVGGEM